MEVLRSIDIQNKKTLTALREPQRTNSLRLLGGHRAPSHATIIGKCINIFNATNIVINF